MDKDWMTLGAFREVANSVLRNRQLFPGDGSAVLGSANWTD